MVDTPAKKYVAPPHFCAACRAQGKTWNGDDPTCAFQHGKPFSPDNWNCATAGMVRDLIGRYHEKAREGIQREYADDQTYATILTHEADLPEDAPNWCLWVTWYKSRGRTGNMMLLGAEESPIARPPTEAEVVAILDYYDPAQQPAPFIQEQMEAFRLAMIAEAVEIEPGVHMLELGAYDPDDDIPF